MLRHGRRIFHPSLDRSYQDRHSAGCQGETCGSSIRISDPIEIARLGCRNIQAGEAASSEVLSFTYLGRMVQPCSGAKRFYRCGDCKAVSTSVASRATRPQTFYKTKTKTRSYHSSDTANDGNRPLQNLERASNGEVSRSVIPRLRTSDAQLQADRSYWTQTIPTERWTSLMVNSDREKLTVKRACRAYFDPPACDCTICRNRKVWTDPRCPAWQALFDAWSAECDRKPESGRPRSIWNPER